MSKHQHTKGATIALAAGAILTASSGLVGLGGAAGAATHGVSSAKAPTGKRGVAHSARKAATSCSGSVGLMAPLTGSVAVIGQQQLHWGQLAATIYNRQNHTHFSVVQGDTQFQPAQATVVARQFLSNGSVLAIVGPSSSAEVEAVGPIMASAHTAFISASATSDTLFSGKYPTFFSVVAKNGQEGSYDAAFIAKKLHAKHVAVVDDQSSYSTELANIAQTTFKRDHVGTVRLSVNQTEIDYAAVISRIPSNVTAVYLPWQVAGNAQLFAEQMAQAHKKAVIVGSDGVASPTEFYAQGSYVSVFSPDITQSKADAALIKQYLSTYHGAVGTYGPPEYVAVMVALHAISSACQAGKPTRASVLTAVRKTDLSTSLLGTPIRFNRYGLLTTAKFYLFKISHKKYVAAN